MRTGIFRFTVAAVLVALAAGSAGAAVARNYEEVRISPTDCEIFSVVGLNDSGVVYGNARQISTGLLGVYRYDVNTHVTAFTSRMGMSMDINNAGAVAGLYGERNLGLQYCVWNPDGTVTDLPQVQTAGNADALISDSGTVLGDRTMPDSSSLKFIWKPDTGMRGLALPRHSNEWQVRDMNNRGYYAGIRPNENSPGWVTALWSESGECLEPGTPSGFNAMRGEFVNDLNQVAGNLTDQDKEHVFLWDSAGVRDLTAGLDGRYWCDGLNNLGQVLINGVYPVGGILRSVQWVWDEEDGLVQIGDMYDPNSDLAISRLWGINNSGWLLANGHSQYSGQNGTMLLRPTETPEPGGIIAMLVGTVGLVGFARRRR